MGDFQLTVLNAGKGVKGEGRGRKVKERLPLMILFFYNRFYRAYFHTASAFRTFFFIDRIRLTLFNRICRTFLYAGAARHAFIGDRIGHFPHPLFIEL